MGSAALAPWRLLLAFIVMRALPSRYVPRRSDGASFPSEVLPRPTWDIRAVKRAAPMGQRSPFATATLRVDCLLADTRFFKLLTRLSCRTSDDAR